MKKAISLLLALVLCLSLCACGVDQKYEALLSNLNAGNYAGIKSELATLSPECKAEQEILAKYKDLIDLLEAEDYDGAIADIQSRIPVPEEPASIEIEITMENWNEYFEIVFVEEWDNNGFTEPKYLYLDYYFNIKEDYVDRITKSSESEVELTFAVDYVSYACEIDYPSMQYTLGEDIDLVPDEMVGTRVKRYSLEDVIDNYCKLTTGYEFSNIIMMPKEPEILSIQGSIYLIEE